MKIQKNIIVLHAITLTLCANNTTPLKMGNLLKELQPPFIERDVTSLIKIKEPNLEISQAMQDNTKIDVNRFMIKGAISLSFSELSQIVAPYEKKKISYKEIQELTHSITIAYRKKGYLAARVYLPVQNISLQNNTIKIEVLEGKYGDFIINNNSLVDDMIIESKFENIKNEVNLKRESLERALLLIDETPGADVASAKVAYSSEIDKSDVVIELEPTQRYNGYIAADNYGSEYLGVYRSMIGLDINSPFISGDKLSFFLIASNKEGLLNGKIAYNLPLYPSSAQMQIGYDKSSYEVGGRYKDLNIIANREQFHIKISYPAIRTREITSDIYITTSANQMEEEKQRDNIYIKKHIYSIIGGFEYKIENLFWQKSQTIMNASYTIGREHFDDKEAKQLNALEENTHGRFSKINIELVENMELTKNIQWHNSLQMQYVFQNKNIDASQNLSLGGISGVKFYHENEESGEKGFIYKSELFYLFQNKKPFLQKISLFYDIGNVTRGENYNNTARTLQDIGVGYKGKYKDFFLTSYMAYKIAHTATSQSSYNSRFLIQTGWVF